MQCPKCNAPNEGYARYCKVCHYNFVEPVEQQLPKNIQETSQKPMQRSPGVTRLAILLIAVGFISLVTLPIFFVKIKNSYTTEEDFLRGSGREYKSDNLDAVKFKEYLESEQGKEILQQMLEAGNFGSTFSIFFRICQKIIYCLALILGIGLFLLKDYARKATVILAGCAIPISVFFNYIGWVRFTRIMRVMLNPVMLKFLKEPEKYSESALQLGQQVASGMGTVFVLISLAVGIAVYSSIIYFLTRPKVKEQFKEGSSLPQSTGAA